MQNSLLWMFAAVAIVGFRGCRAREVGMTVVYEVDAEETPSLPEMTDGEARKLLAAIDRRLVRGSHRLGRVKQLDGGTIEVDIFRDDIDEMRRVADLVPRPGTLEFRILANERDHPHLIDVARKSDEQIIYMVDADGKAARNEDGERIVRGWWVPLSEEADQGILKYPEIATRTRQIGDRSVTEVLVIKEPYDVTGAYLVRSTSSTDQSGRPSVRLMFNGAGGRLFAGLTGDNVPDMTQSFTRKLGIILDGQLFSAPAIWSQIRDGCEITGNFSQQETEDLARVLNAGTLPVPIREVERRVVDAAE